MAARLKLAVRHAVSFVEEFLLRHGLKPGDELPPLQTMATAAQVSRVTMWAALNEMKRRQRVTGVAGHPFRVGSSGESERDVSDSRADISAPTTQSTAFRRAQKKMQEEILNGVLTPGTVLPSIKELEARYGVAFKTLKKALDGLIAEGIIERHKKGYAVPAYTAPGWRPRIICLKHSFDSFTMYLAQHDEDLIRGLERQCATARIQLDIFLVFPESLDPRAEEHILLRDRRTGRVFEIDELSTLTDASIVGFLLQAPGRPGALEDRLLRTLAPLKKPLAILDEPASWSLPEEFRRMPNVRLFAAAGSQDSSRAVARYLLGLGHRNVAFISPTHENRWSQRRLDGIAAVYAAAGDQTGLTLYTAEGLQKAHVRTAPLQRAYSSFRKSLEAPQRIDFDAWMQRMREYTMRSSLMRSNLYPLLERALSERDRTGATAWVTVNDHTALMALEFLAERKVRVPGDLSLISFDDSVDALRLNLTSYNFNSAGMATAVLGYFLNRKPFASAKGSAASQIQGYIVERQTTGPAPQRPR